MKRLTLKFWIGLAMVLLPAAGLFADNAKPGPIINSGDTAWLLTSSALVLLMTIPALALFYGGLVRKKNILSVIYYSFACAIVISILWVICEYSLIFNVSTPLEFNPDGSLAKKTTDAAAAVHGLLQWVGTLKSAFFNGIGVNTVNFNGPTVPENAYSMFQLMFAIITVALISGAIAERMSFIGWFVFLILWSFLVYTPIAHLVWNPEGFLAQKGALDFAGGLVVHASSGVSALVACIVLGPRAGFRKNPISPPANIGYVFIGAVLLWVGWFGFNAGSAVAANGLASSAFMVTHTAAAMAALTWLILEWIIMKKPSVVGACTGAVAGLVAITPASGFVNLGGALVIGIVVSLISFTFMAVFRKIFKYDDALDVFSVHGLGGTWGALATGIFAVSAVNSAGKGLVDGNPGQVLIQLMSIGIAWGIAVAGTLICLFLTNLITGGRLRVTVKEEAEGLDISQHGEQIESAN